MIASVITHAKFPKLSLPLLTFFSRPIAISVLHKGSVRERAKKNTERIPPYEYNQQAPRIFDLAENAV